MACIILHDPENERAIFFDTVTERPVNHEAFAGRDALEQAEDFWAWEDFDPRSYPRGGYTLDQMIELWRAEAFDDAEHFVGADGRRRDCA